jgi:hypothetical protein
MAARLVRFAFKAHAGAGRLHGRQLSSPYDVEIRFPACAGGLARAVCMGPRTSQRRRLVVRGGDLSCEAETCHARRRLVGDAAFGQGLVVLPVSLDEDMHAFPETQRQVESALLMDVVISKGTLILKLLAS